MAENLLTNEEIDAIGEVLNISMGSAATAISTLLDKQVIITTPKVEIQKFEAVNYTDLEPAILVKIEYVEGISGSNVMIFRQSDMQVILNLLMGNEDPPSDDFVFDEMSMSAACEVMNQMMGASATALSTFLGKTINISTPTATVMDPVENTFEKALGVDGDKDVVSIGFEIDITGVMKTDFASILTCELAKEMVGQLFPEGEPEPAPAPAPQPAAPAQPQQAPQAPQGYPQQPQTPPQASQGYPQQPQQMPPQQSAQAPQGYPQQPQQPMGQQPGMPPMGGQDWGQQQGYPPYGYPPYGYPQQQGYPPYGYPPYGYPPQEQERQTSSNIIRQDQQVPVQMPKFPSFAGPQPPAAPPPSGNLDLMMNVPLNVAVEIGKTKKKIREIMDFSQGTVIELEKQAGAPVDIIVNGQLIARGDVVVVADNFGVRITEIVGTKDLMDTLEHSK